MASSNKASPIISTVALVAYGKPITDFDTDRCEKNISIELQVQGRNSRQLDDEIYRLRNEVFNLKLRIHLFEEDSNKSPESIQIKKDLENATNLIELLNREVEEKSDLLVEASTTITRHEEIYKNSLLVADLKMEEQIEYIKLLESKLEDQLTEKPDESSNLEKIKILEETIFYKIDELAAAKRQIEFLESKLTVRNKSIENCIAKINCLYKENSELQKISKKYHGYTVMFNQINEINNLKMQISAKEKMELLRIIDSTSPEMANQHAILNKALAALKTMQKREALIIKTLNNYRYSSMKLHHNARKCLVEVKKFRKTYRKSIDCSDSSDSDGFSVVTSRSSISSTSDSATTATGSEK